MVMLDLRKQAQEANITISDITPLNDEERERAIGTWRGRMVNEHISARVFAAMIPQMMKAGLDADWIARVAVMISDELRHGQQCAAVVHALGGEAHAALPALPDVPEHPDATPVEAFLRNAISIGCMGETVAVALVRAEHEEVGPPELKEVLGKILADEVQHARFGWEALRELAPNLDAATKSRLSNYLVVAFKYLRHHELLYLPVNHEPQEQEQAVGVCDGRDARSIFFDTVEQVIIPGLEEHGLRARDAWNASFDAGEARGVHREHAA